MVGSVVHVKDEKTGKSVKYTIVGSAEAKPEEQKLSNESPVGRALIGRKRNETVAVKVPRGPARKLKITKIAEVTKRPSDVVGLHFFSPANVMKLLEVVRGSATAPDVLATGMALGRVVAPENAHAAVHGIDDARVADAPSFALVMAELAARTSGVLVMVYNAPYDVTVLNAEAIRASCGLPLIFEPIQLSGRWLVDGGLVNPVPTRVIADMGKAGQQTAQGELDEPAVGAVHLVDERIEQCIFVSPRPDLPSRAWLASLFVSEALTQADRAGLLAGQALPAIESIASDAIDRLVAHAVPADRLVLELLYGGGLGILGDFFTSAQARNGKSSALTAWGAPAEDHPVDAWDKVMNLDRFDLH